MKEVTPMHIGDALVGFVRVEGDTSTTLTSVTNCGSPYCSIQNSWSSPQSLEECQLRYDVALKDLKALERSEHKASAQRDKCLVEKADAYASQGEVSAAQYLKQLKQRESMSRVFQRCANAQGANCSGGFSAIEVPQDPNVPPKDCTEWKTLDCPQKVKKALLE